MRNVESEVVEVLIQDSVAKLVEAAQHKHQSNMRQYFMKADINPRLGADALPC